MWVTSVKVSSHSLFSKVLYLGYTNTVAVQLPLVVFIAVFDTQ